MLDPKYLVHAARAESDALPVKAAPVSAPNAFGQQGLGPHLLGAMTSAIPTGGEAQAQAASLAYGISMMKSGPLSVFDNQLAALYMEHSPLKAATAGFTSTVAQFADSLSTGADGKQYVVIDAVAADGDGAHLLSQLNAAGLQAGASFHGVASGMIAVDNLDALLHLSDLGAASESMMVTRAGRVTTQAAHAEHTDVATDLYGVTGDGIRVGILSDSFDRNGKHDDMASNIASDDLPTDTQLIDDSAGHGDEGRAMAQLVHDLAPGAAIDFATAWTGVANFANNILALASAGDRVIVDDVGYFNELAYQNGPIAQAVEQVTAQGVAYFSSAGNDGSEGLEQNWVTGQTQTIGGQTEAFMEFDDGGQDYVKIKIHGSAYLVLQWDDPGKSAGNGSPGADTDLDLFVTNKDGTTVTASATRNNIHRDPVELVSLSGDGTYYIRVGLAGGPAPGEIKLMALGNGADVDLDTTSRNFNSGTDYGHPAAPGGTAVGAAYYAQTPAYGALNPQIESYSSMGPTRFWYDDEGNRLVAPVDQLTPQITAVDGGDTTSFFGNYDPDNTGYPNFFGTSAAAPDAAAVAALMLEARGNLSPADIQNLLKDSAIDMNDPTTRGFDRGDDRATGAGLIQADRAVAFAQDLHIQNDGAKQLYGTHLGDTIIGNGQQNLILGGYGNDHITGGIGGDDLSGSDGADTFVYTMTADSTTRSFDEINDLTNLDVIDLSAIDADETTLGDQQFAVVNHFDGQAGELVVKFHHKGDFAGMTTIKAYTNDAHRPDMLIVLDGDHHDFDGFTL